MKMMTAEEKRAREKALKRANYAVHREEYLARRKIFYATHREELRAEHKVYDAAHKAETAIYHKAYYAAHREELNAKKKAYYVAHQEKIRARARAYHAAHREEKNAYHKNYFVTHKKEIKDHRLKINFGLIQTKVDDLLNSQGGQCAICRTNKFNKVGPVIDHDHFTGKTRGILCSNCNSVLGFSRDCTDILEAAIKYLEKHGGGWAVDIPPKLAAMIQREK